MAVCHVHANKIVILGDFLFLPFKNLNNKFSMISWTYDFCISATSNVLNSIIGNKTRFMLVASTNLCEKECLSRQQINRRFIRDKLHSIYFKRVWTIDYRMVELIVKRFEIVYQSSVNGLLTLPFVCQKTSLKFWLIYGDYL